ncbi:hypothetical protein Tco_0814320 [Tanacetum coccineum]
MQLKGVQTAIDDDPHNQSVSPNEAKLVEEFYEAKDDEENFLYQQAKIKCDNSCIRHEGEQIPQVFLKHFEEFLGTSHPVQEIKSIKTLFNKRFRIEEADKMIGEFLSAEIMKLYLILMIQRHLVMMDLHQLSSKKTWSVIGDDIYKACDTIIAFTLNVKGTGLDISKVVEVSSKETLYLHICSP